MWRSSERSRCSPTVSGRAIALYTSSGLSELPSARCRCRRLSARASSRAMLHAMRRSHASRFCMPCDFFTARLHVRSRTSAAAIPRGRCGSSRAAKPGLTRMREMSSSCILILSTCVAVNKIRNIDDPRRLMLRENSVFLGVELSQKRSRGL